MVIFVDERYKCGRNISFTTDIGPEGNIFNNYATDKCVTNIIINTYESQIRASVEEIYA